MPRRARPASRRPPKSNQSSSQYTKADKSKKSTLKRRFEEVEPDDGSDDSSEYEDIEDDNEQQLPAAGMGSDNNNSDSNTDDEDDDIDIDAPRIALWEGDENVNDSASERDEKEEDSPDISRLQNDLSSLPLGALRRAQRALAQAEADSDSSSASDRDEDDSDDDQSNSSPEQDFTRPSREESSKKKKVEWSTKPRTDIAKRANKHAPTEVTSKRPITRKRQVVEVPRLESRDPRFLPIASSPFSPSHFTKHYSFLSQSRRSELSTLRESLARAQKLLANSPQDLRDEREVEVKRLEGAVRRMEGVVKRDKREAIERAALEKVEHEEKAKRKEGKQGWWMKDSEKKNLLVKARLEAIEAEGGKRAVKKAVEKKKRKIGQKEKKARPFSARGGEGVGDSGKRPVGGAPWKSRSQSFQQPRPVSGNNTGARKRHKAA